MTEVRAVDGGAASDRAAAGRLSTEDRQRASCWWRAADGGPATRRPSTEGGRAVDGWKGAYVASAALIRSRGACGTAGGGVQIKGCARCWRPVPTRLLTS